MTIFQISRTYNPSNTAENLIIFMEIFPLEEEITGMKQM